MDFRVDTFMDDMSNEFILESMVPYEPFNESIAYKGALLVKSMVDKLMKMCNTFIKAVKRAFGKFMGFIKQMKGEAKTVGGRKLNTSPEFFNEMKAAVDKQFDNYGFGVLDLCHIKGMQDFCFNAKGLQPVEKNRINKVLHFISEDNVIVETPVVVDGESMYFTDMNGLIRSLRAVDDDMKFKEVVDACYKPQDVTININKGEDYDKLADTQSAEVFNAMTRIEDPETIEKLTKLSQNTMDLFLSIYYAILECAPIIDKYLEPIKGGR